MSKKKNDFEPFVMSLKVTSYEDTYKVESDMHGLDPFTLLDGVADAILSFKDDEEGMDALDISTFAMYFAETLTDKYVNAEVEEVAPKKKNTNIKRIK